MCFQGPSVFPRPEFSERVSTYVLNYISTQMHVISLKSGPRGREEGCGVTGPIVHGETVTGVRVQEAKRK